jgi:lipopolysaccharide heptosyltransferase II
MSIIGPEIVHPPERVLVVKFWGMGSLLLARPTLACLRATWPAARIDLLTLEENAGLARLIPEIDTVWTLSLRSLPRLPARLLRLRADLRRGRYDLGLDLEFFVHASILIMAASGIPRRLGFARRSGGKRRLLHRAVPFRDDAHTAENFLALTAAATDGQGDQRAAEPRPLQVPEGRAPDRPYVVLNVNAGALAYERRWPREFFIVLARRLLDAFPIDLVLIGSAEERGYVQSVVDSVIDGVARETRVRNAAGEMAIDDLCACLARARAVISNDSGPAHLAAALGRPVVAFFGPETPARYAPRGPAVHIVYGARFCSPCMTIENAKTVRCPYQAACMRELEPDAVWPGIAAFLRRYAKG